MLKYFILFITLSISSIAYANPQKALNIIYVHGLGGMNQESAFVHNVKEMMNEYQLKNIHVAHYSWDSPTIEAKIAPARFKQGLDKAKQEATVFATEVLNKYETKNQPYYIIAHSLGAYLVLEAFKNYTESLSNLKNIYFLGAAVSRDYKVSSNLPKSIKIDNYYSDNYDLVLPLFFSYLGKKSGGEVGFDDLHRFKNHRTTCTHNHKGIAFHRDYSTLAEAITYLILLQEKIHIKNADYKIGQRRIWKGLMSWHDIYTFKNIKINKIHQDVLLQQRWNTKNYRLVIHDVKQKPSQIAKGRGLHDMLRVHGIEPLN